MTDRTLLQIASLRFPLLAMTGRTALQIASLRFTALNDGINNIADCFASFNCARNDGVKLSNFLILA
jgi:hypothetical protein